MVKDIFEDWLADRDALAIKLTSRGFLGGLFKKKIIVPLNTSAFVMYTNGTSTLFKDGQIISGDFNVLLIKNSDIELKLDIPDLITACDAKFRADCTITLSIITKQHFLKDFLKDLFNFPSVFTIKDLKKYIMPELKNVFTQFVSREPASEIDKANKVKELTEIAKVKLEQILFNVGVKVLDLKEIRFSSATSKIDSPIRPSTEGHQLLIEKTKELLLAIGNKVITIDAYNIHNTKEFTFRGPIRSVRTYATKGEEILLAGSKTSVYLYLIDKKGETIEFALPKGKEPKGGINSTCLWNEYLYATHSEFGLVRWNWHKPKNSPELVLNDITSKNSTTRAAQIVNEKLFFATGPSIISLDLNLKDAKPIFYKSNTENIITTFCLIDDTIFAGTEPGCIFKWNINQPNEPSLLLKRKESIISMRYVKINSLPYLLYSSKEPLVHARVIGQNLEILYESNEFNIGILDAASDFIYAIDTMGYKILVWDISTPSKPKMIIDSHCFSEKPILDICLVKT